MIGVGGVPGAGRWEALFDYLYGFWLRPTQPLSARTRDVAPPRQSTARPCAGGAGPVRLGRAGHMLNGDVTVGDRLVRDEVSESAQPDGFDPGLL